ncbi:MAG: ArnT family glycosyltransferase [Candidatus Eiseniibacteriota bacterium]
MAFLLRGIRPYFALVLLSLALYLPGLVPLPPFDRDEARFVQATRQMIEDQDFIRIQFQHEPRHKKPAGIYWLQAASVEAFGTPDGTALWPYRLPSLLGILAAVLLTFGIGQRLFGRREALLAAALLGVSISAVLEAHLAKTDAVLLATVVAAEAALARVYMKARAGEDAGLVTALGFWAALGLGMLIKGPITPMVALLTVAALALPDRGTGIIRPLRPLLGIPLAAIIFLPWLVAVNRIAGGDFAGEAVRQDLLPKLLGDAESHGFPPGFYLVLLTLTFWPGSIFVWHALVWAWQRRRDAAVRFCLAWVVPSWIVFELVPSKLPHYVLPLYPALALLTGAALVAAGDGLVTRLGSIESRVGFVAWALVTLALGGGIVALPIGLDGRFDPVTLVPLAAAVLTAAIALSAAWRGRVIAASAVAIVGSFFVLAPTLQWVLPRVDALWLSRSAEQLVARNTPAGAKPPVVVAIGYQEPSLVFLLGRDTALIKPQEAPAFLAKHPDALLLLGDNLQRQVLDVLHRAGRDGKKLGAVRGFNYSKGIWLTLTLFKPVPLPPDGGRPDLDRAARPLTAPARSG